MRIITPSTLTRAELILAMVEQLLPCDDEYQPNEIFLYKTGFCTGKVSGYHLYEMYSGRAANVLGDDVTEGLIFNLGLCTDYNPDGTATNACDRYDYRIDEVFVVAQDVVGWFAHGLRPNRPANL